jgi:hypothetical protein
VLSCNVDHIVNAFSRHIHTRHVERLSVNIAIDVKLESLPKVLRLTFSGVRMVSFRMAPVGAESYCEMETGVCA